MVENSPGIELPTLPSYTRTAPEPTVYKGESATQAVAEHKAVIRTLNGRIVSTKKWYEGVRKDYGRK